LSNILKYRCNKEKFFLDYLPDEFFIKLENKERIEYRKIRENHQIIESKSLEITALKKEIKKKQALVKKLKNQITPSKSNRSYFDKMNEAKKNLAEIINKYQFSISIGLRTHKTSSNKPSLPKFYLRITASEKRFKNLYIGSSERIKISLSNIYNQSFNNLNNEQLKAELKVLYSVYTRNFIWKNSWDIFFDSKHSLKDLEIWCNDMGNDIFRW
tara:strand:+ start:767 stop:1408 length:642 start_codon:yes stop_codon:yes gene_type:complete